MSRTRYKTRENRNLENQGPHTQTQGKLFLKYFFLRIFHSIKSGCTDLLNYLCLRKAMSSSRKQGKLSLDKKQLLKTRFYTSIIGFMILQLTFEDRRFTMYFNTNAQKTILYIGKWHHFKELSYSLLNSTRKEYIDAAVSTEKSATHWPLSREL